MTSVSVPRTQPIAASGDNHHFVVTTIQRAKDYAAASQSENTRRGYESDWRSFSSFCLEHGLSALPADPQTVALYMTDQAEKLKAATLKRRLAAISVRHREMGFESPVANEVVRRVVRGISKVHGTAQVKKDPIALNELRSVLLAIRGDDLKSIRDRAIVLIGFCGALRRSEIAALNVEDVAFTDQGMRITLRRSKTDTLAAGTDIAIPYVRTEGLCAATAVRGWLKASEITAGPLFRSFSLTREMKAVRIKDRAVAELIKLLTRKAGLNGDYSAHSLRAGFATAAARAGVSLDRIARTTRHRSLTVLIGYVRRASLFEDPALAAVIQ